MFDVLTHCCDFPSFSNVFAFGGTALGDLQGYWERLTRLEQTQASLITPLYIVSLETEFI